MDGGCTDSVNEEREREVFLAGYRAGWLEMDTRLSIRSVHTEREVKEAYERWKHPLERQNATSTA